MMLREWRGQEGAAAREEYLERRADNDYKVNHMAQLLHPTLHDAVELAKTRISAKREESARWVSRWHSVFPGLAVMENRTTGIHRDDNGAFFCADFLYLLGSFVGGDLCLPDLDLRLEWLPGVACMFDGRTFSHEVARWEGTRRLCFSHYLWKTSMRDLKVTLPDSAPDLAGITGRVQRLRSEIERERIEKEKEKERRSREDTDGGGLGPPGCPSDGEGEDD